MKVKITKTMARALQKAIPQFKFVYKEYTEHQYHWHVNIYANDEDFDYTKNVYKTICVLYPYEYYAIPRYLTTRDLVEAYQHSNKTYDGFIKSILDFIQV